MFAGRPANSARRQLNIKEAPTLAFHARGKSPEGVRAHSPPALQQNTRVDLAGVSAAAAAAASRASKKSPA